MSLFARRRLIAGPPREHGFLSIHPENPYAFAYADGTPFFPMGDTCYGLHDDSPVTPELRRKYLEVRRSQRFNFVRMSIGHSAKRAAAEQRFWAWGGTADVATSTASTRSSSKLGCSDASMAEHGMNAELLLLNFYRRLSQTRKRGLRDANAVAALCDRTMRFISQHIPVDARQ